MHTNIIGWDIGGAHLKAVALNQVGDMVAIYQQPCPLWKGINELHDAIKVILHALEGLPIQHHAITMTGELVDLFTNRNEGVRQIISTIDALLIGATVHIFAGFSGFVKTAYVEQHYQAIASANWLASALLAAKYVDSALFVDVGSTTTDILLINNGQVLAKGYTDYQRLISQELIYTGVIRTPVMAVAHTAYDEGHTVGIMAEYFATMADVYRITGELNEKHDQTATADGAEKTRAASIRRLARMIGCDFNQDALPRWQRFAENIRHQQLQRIQRGCQAQLQRNYQYHPQPLALIGAGVGRFLVKNIASNLGRTYTDFSSLFSKTSEQLDLTIADCAPAFAVAYLLKAHLADRSMLD